MSWAAERRLVVLTILGALLIAGAVIIYIAGFYRAPSCVDGIQNQNETGIDCGGSCSRLCTAAQLPPTVLFTTALSNGVGRTDIIAEVENKNAAAAAKQVTYQVSIYGIGQSLIQQLSGTLDLPPGARVPVFIPISSGSQTVASAFLEISPSSPEWYSVTGDPRTVPTVSNTIVGGTTAAPRVDATLSNPMTEAMINVSVVALVHDANGDVIAASRTLVPRIPAQGTANATFTWNVAFARVPASIEVIPVIPLP